MKYFVQIYTNTDGDFSYESIRGFVPMNDRRIIAQDFETLEAAVAGAKNQYQHMIDTLQCSDSLKESLIGHFQRMLFKLDFVYDAGNLNCVTQSWDNGNQCGYLLITLHDCVDVFEMIKSCVKQANVLHEKLMPFGYSCYVKSGL